MSEREGEAEGEGGGGGEDAPQIQIQDGGPMLRVKGFGPVLYSP